MMGRAAPMMPSHSDLRELIAQRLHQAAGRVWAAGVRVERGEDCVTLLRELADARIELDEVRCLLAAHEAQICLAVLADSTCPAELRRASERFTRLCTA